MLRIGIIGYGGRIMHMARALQPFGIPFAVTAVADPRREQILANDDGFLNQARFYDSADELLNEAAQLDGIMIGTRCNLHTEMACKVAKTGLPIFLEKPVAINFGQLQQLAAAFQGYTAPTMVSFPLRVSPLLERVRDIIQQGQLGAVEHVDAFNDVPYGSVYYRSWYRDASLTGGLWLQKATHDLDYLHFLVGQTPKTVAAMGTKRVFGGDQPWELQCKDCSLRESCPESPFVRFRRGYDRASVQFAEHGDYCVFSTGIDNDDISNCMITYEGGAQLSYTQNVFARYRAERRGARLLGSEGTLEFDWYQNRIQIFSHRQPTVETIEFTGDMPHFGGDRELAYDWLLALRDGQPSRSPLEAGILSALTCLWARESAHDQQFYAIRMPESLPQVG